MVNILIGNIFDSNSQTLVNTVNCVGVMGKGIALEFKKQFPDMFKDYFERCKHQEVKLGRPYLYKRLVPPWVLNFPTKDHWRSVANLDDIIRGLEYLLKHYKEWGISSLAVPPLGCGHGQLEWRIVGPTLYRYLSKMDIPIAIYAPYGTPHEEITPEFLDSELSVSAQSPMPEPQWIKPAWVALVDILYQLEKQPYHWPVGRTIFQKIAYIATEEGLPTGLEYQRGSYGPFSPNVKSMLARLINNGLVKEERLEQMLCMKVGPTYEDARKAYILDLKRWEPIIEKISDLFMRMTTKQAEIVSTIIFVTTELLKKKHKPSEQEVLDAVMSWKSRRKPELNHDEVALNIRNLAALEWLDVKPSRNLKVPDEIAV